MPIHSSKLRRQQQNANAYQRRILNSTSSSESPINPDFPSSLHDRASYKIRSTLHFIRAYQDQSLPILILGIWEPLYLPIVLLDTTCYDGSTSNFLDVLHGANGHQLRLLEEQGHERRKLSTDERTSGEMLQRMSEEIDVRLSSWIIEDKKFAQLEGLDWEVMTGELALEWGAKIIHCLKDEIRVREMGHANYLEAYEGGQLAWQSIDVIG